MRLGLLVSGTCSGLNRTCSVGIYSENKLHNSSCTPHGTSLQVRNNSQSSAMKNISNKVSQGMCNYHGKSYPGTTKYCKSNMIRNDDGRCDKNNSNIEAVTVKCQESSSNSIINDNNINNNNKESDETNSIKICWIDDIHQNPFPLQHNKKHKNKNKKHQNVKANSNNNNNNNDIDSIDDNKFREEINEKINSNDKEIESFCLTDGCGFISLNLALLLPKIVSRGIVIQQTEDPGPRDSQSSIFKCKKIENTETVCYQNKNKNSQNKNYHCSQQQEQQQKDTAHNNQAGKKETRQEIPAAFQVRIFGPLGIFKGTLIVNKNIPDNIIAVRPSMQKVNPSIMYEKDKYYDTNKIYDNYDSEDNINNYNHNNNGNNDDYNDGKNDDSDSYHFNTHLHPCKILNPNKSK